MKHCPRFPGLIVTVGLLLIALSGTAQAQEEVTYTWTAPTTGSPVDHYVVQVSVDGGPFVTENDAVSGNTYVLTAQYEHEYVIRVAGVDGSGRQGPYSASSDPYMPSLGAPGQPGKPVAVF